MFENYRSASPAELTPECFALFTDSHLFDRDWYTRTYPDIFDSNLSPELHYLLVGGFASYDPCAAFNSAAYLKRYPDAVESKLNPLIHFLLIGRKERRKIDISQKESSGLSDFHWVVFEHVRTLGEIPDIFHPVTFSEKIQAYKLFYRDPLAQKLADKVAVRDYVREKIGPQYLIPLVGIYSDPDEIDVKSLPDKFVMKAAHGSGWNYYCDNKAEMNWEAVRNQFRAWLNDNYTHYYREWVYQDIPPRIIIERLLTADVSAPPRDYKVFCFDGKPAYIQVDYDRATQHRRNFYSLDWELLPMAYKYPATEVEKRPENLDEMLEVCRKLSAGLPFARVDLYAIPEVYFGEITFNPGAGFGKFTPDEWNTKSVADMHIEKIIKKIPEIAHDDTRSALEKVHIDTLDADFLLYPRFADTSRCFSKTLAGALTAQVSKQVSTFVDIGAHFGLFSVLAGKTNLACDILAFDAAPENARVARQNLEANEVKARVISAAVGCETGDRDYEISSASDGCGFKAAPDCEVVKTIPVQTVRLDTTLEKVQDGLLFVKIDSGGCELDTLRSMRGLLAERRDTRLLIRFDPRRMFANGFHPLDLCAELSAQSLRYFFIDEDRQLWNGLAAGEDWLKPGYLYCVDAERSLNVCLFVSSPEMSAATRLWLDWARVLVRDRGVICTVVIPGQGPLVDEMKAAGAGVLVCGGGISNASAGPTPGETGLDSAQAFALFEQVRAANPDVILSGGLTPWGVVAARQLNKPHVWLREGDRDGESATASGEFDRMLREGSNVTAGMETVDSSDQIEAWQNRLYQTCLSLKGLPNPNSRRLADFENTQAVKWIREQREETRTARAALEKLSQAQRETSARAEQLAADKLRLEREIARLNQVAQDVLGSTSWRVTRPLRELVRRITGK